MSKQELVSRFLEAGVLLSPDVLEQMNDKDVDDIVNRAKKNKELVISDIEQQTKVDVVKVKQKKKLSPKDFVDYYQKKHQMLGEILSKKVMPVSINKLGSGQATIIAWVREAGNGVLTLEDATGTIEARCDFGGPNKTTLGFRGEAKEGVFFVKDVVYPDIPLKREIPKIDSDLLLTTNQNKITPPGGDPKKGDITFVYGDQIKTNPCLSKVTRSGVNVNLLSYEPPKEASQQNAINYLKNRFIPEDSPNEKFLLVEVPDVFWLIQDKQFAENYKGVTIVSGKEVEINLGTRKAKNL